jgi:hypothetical protein
MRGPDVALPPPIAQPELPASMPTTASRTRWLALNYAATIFLSAFLLFQVQPLVSKYILPWFGGSPAVWTTCMLFFQSLLFAGYAYAHFSAQRLNTKQQAMLHMAVILTALVAILVLGAVPGERWKPTDSADPVGRILLLLTASVGLPYFVLSTTGPLIQSWFSRSFPGRTPYRLYALSNVGSLLALLSYPVVFERLFDVRDQAIYWSWGFAAFAILCGIAAIWSWKGNGGQKSEGPAIEGLVARDLTNDVAGSSPSLWYRALWLLLPAAASTTLLATTNHVCTDVAVMPFLWVVPLALYLLTFIIAFDHPRWYRPALISVATIAAIYGTAIGIGGTDLYDCGIPGACIKWLSDRWTGTATESPTIHVTLLPYLALSFGAMFGICLLCHGELVRLRPDPKHLTAFYLMISAGGAIGGIFVTLIAPRIFNTFYEWELSTYFGFVLAVGLLLREIARMSYRRVNARGFNLGIFIPLALLLALVAVIGAIDLRDYLKYAVKGVQFRARNFFGTLVVSEFDKENADHYTIFKHGVTTHGMQFLADERRAQPTTYYSQFGGVGRTLTYLKGLSQAPPLSNDDEQNAKIVTDFRRAHADPAADGAAAAQSSSPKGLKIGAVGLGVGTLAAYVGPGDSIRFYEINPAVIDIATGDKWFTFLEDCQKRGGHVDTKLGDARLTIERELPGEPGAHYDLLVLDAFSGDAIPVHLLTEEAFKVYMQRLATRDKDGRDGAIAIHIQNHYVGLEPVVRALAERFGLGSVRIKNPKIRGVGVYASEWMILSKDESLLAALAPFAAHTDSDTPQKPAILWTDGRSNLFDVLK